MKKAQKIIRWKNKSVGITLIIISSILIVADVGIQLAKDNDKKEINVKYFGLTGVDLMLFTGILLLGLPNKIRINSWTPDPVVKLKLKLRKPNIEPKKAPNLVPEYTEYRKTGTVFMRPYVEGEDMTGISLSEADKKLETLVGGMIATNPNKENDFWYVAKEYFDENYEEA